MLTTCLLRVVAHLVPCSFLGTDRCSPFPGLQLFFLWSYWSSCDQWHSLKLGFSIFLPLMATVTMCAAAALGQSPTSVVAVPGCQHPLLVTDMWQEGYLSCGVLARLSLFSLKPPQRQARISPGVFLSHGFLNCLTEGSALSWAEVSGVFLSCSSALRLPPSINGLLECDGSKLPRLFQFLISCWVHRICLLCAQFE